VVAPPRNDTLTVFGATDFGHCLTSQFQYGFRTWFDKIDLSYNEDTSQQPLHETARSSDVIGVSEHTCRRPDTCTWSGYVAHAEGCIPCFLRRTDTTRTGMYHRCTEGRGASFFPQGANEVEQNSEIGRSPDITSLAADHPSKFEFPSKIRSPAGITGITLQRLRMNSTE
jgi:hypothetical protein